MYKEDKYLQSINVFNGIKKNLQRNLEKWKKVEFKTILINEFNCRKIILNHNNFIENVSHNLQISLQDVLKSTTNISGSCAPDILTGILESKERNSNRYGRHIPLTKKQGVSGESPCLYDFDDIQVQKHEKDFKYVRKYSKLFYLLF